MAKRMGFWTEEHVNFLRENYPFVKNQDLADILGISIYALLKAARKFKLHKSSVEYKLTSDIKDKIIKAYPYKCVRVIAKELHISERTIVYFIKSLADDGIKIRRSQEEKNRLVSITRNELIKSEKGKDVFGLEHKSKIKLGRNRRETYMRHKLNTFDCYEIDRGSMDVFIVRDEGRRKHLEQNAKRLGFKFFVPCGEADEDGMVEYRPLDNINY